VQPGLGLGGKAPVVAAAHQQAGVAGGQVDPEVAVRGARLPAGPPARPGPPTGARRGCTPPCRRRPRRNRPPRPNPPPSERPLRSGQLAPPWPAAPTRSRRVRETPFPTDEQSSPRSTAAATAAAPPPVLGRQRLRGIGGALHGSRMDDTRRRPPPRHLVTQVQGRVRGATRGRAGQASSAKSASRTPRQCARPR
jgi:hypothetical protein